MATVQFLQHILSSGRRRFPLRESYLQLTAFIQHLLVSTATLVDAARQPASLKTAAYYLSDAVTESLVQNLFGPYVSKAFFVLVLQAYALPLLQTVVCYTRRLALLSGLMRSKATAQSFNPCYCSL